jgi:AcrR family transcriptional regulator
MAEHKEGRQDPHWRNVILDAARRCLSAKGFHATTIDDVSRTVPAPRSVVYRHFSNKQALLNETVKRSSHETLAVITELIERAGSGPGSVGRLADLMYPLFTTSVLFDVGRFNIEWWAWAVRNEAGLSGFRDVWREWRSRLASLIASEFETDQSTEMIQAMTTLMLAIYNGLLLHATLEGEQLDLERIMRYQQYGWEGIIERVKAEPHEGSNV